MKPFCSFSFSFQEKKSLEFSITIQTLCHNTFLIRELDFCYHFAWNLLFSFFGFWTRLRGCKVFLSFILWYWKASHVPSPKVRKCAVMISALLEAQILKNDSLYLSLLMDKIKSYFLVLEWIIVILIKSWLYSSSLSLLFLCYFVALLLYQHRISKKIKG